jgi:Spy/CpxP family protein refolding chaperone
MKHTLAVGFATLLAATALIAQRGPGGPRPDGAFSPEQMVERRIQQLTTTLALTATQQQQAKTILTEEAAAISALQPKMAAANEALKNAIHTTGLDADIERAAAEQGALLTQMTISRGKSQAKLRAILTPEQKEKLDSVGGPGRGMQGVGPMRGFGGR